MITKVTQNVAQNVMSIVLWTGHHAAVCVGAEFNAPPSRHNLCHFRGGLHSQASHLTDTDKQDSTGNTQTRYNSPKANNVKYSKTKLRYHGSVASYDTRPRNKVRL